MILRPKTLLELAAQVKSLPPEKRKVVILAGRHPNEGTLNLAARYHEDWEPHGALVIALPGAWTPHGFWKQVQTLIASRNRPRRIRLAETIPTDQRIIRTLHSIGVKVPVVNLHGTPGSQRDFEIGVNQRAPLQVNAAVRDTKLAWKNILVTRGTESDTQHPHEVLVEYYFGGKKSSAKRRAKALRRERVYHHDQLDKDYLRENRISRTALKTFDHHYRKPLNALIENLSKTPRK